MPNTTQEIVLCIPRTEWEKREAFQGFRSLEGRMDLFEYLSSEPNRLGYFVPKNDAEEDDNHLQLIPYVAIMNGDKILTYYRSKSGGEGRLHGKMSIGIGGHINTQDDKDDVSNAYVQGTKREIREEIGMDVTDEVVYKTILGLLKDETNPVGRVHLGVVHVIEVNDLQAEAILHNCEHTLYDPKFIDLGEFDNPDNYGILESWSQFLVSHLLQKFCENGKWNDAAFKERVGMLALTASNLATAAMSYLMEEAPHAHNQAKLSVEEAAGATQCMLSGLSHHKDINIENLKTKANEFRNHLGNVLRHQPEPENGDG